MNSLSLEVKASPSAGDYPLRTGDSTESADGQKKLPAPLWVPAA